MAVGDKVYLYLMEQGSGKAQHLHVLVYDLDFGTSINQQSQKKAANSVSLSNVNKNGFSLKTLNDNVYAITFYSVKGKLKYRLSKKLSAGSHHIAFEKDMSASGMYLVEIRNGLNTQIEKIVLK